MPQGLDPQNFYNALQGKAGGLSRDFLFRVTGINMESSGSGDFQGMGAGDLIYARAASLPGRIIQDNIANYSGHEFHLGGRATYSQSAGWPIEFYCDESSRVRSVLEGMSTGTFHSGVGGGVLGGKYGVSNSANITLQQLGKQFTSIANYILHGAQIREIGDIDYLIADGVGAIVTFQATFAYQYYTVG